MIEIDAQLDWDGSELAMRGPPRSRVTVHVDDVPFARLELDINGRATLAFPFSPSGHATVNFSLQAAPMASASLGAVFGEPGFVARSMPRPLAPTEGNEWLDSAAVFVPRETVVVVPVHDAPDDVRVCLDAVLVHTPDVRLVVIDDASPDPAVAPLLARYAARATVLSNERNLGFTATANLGIATAGAADVVLLNADTEVGPLWLTGLRRAVYASSNTASATAVSDNAGAFSVPELERDNPPPPGWSAADVARALWQDAGCTYPRMPTGNGFCMYFRRDAIVQAGILDGEAFPQGYGEENDWCQRAEACGWRHVIAGNVFVRHARSRSFGHERRRTLGAAGMDVLRSRWPNYEAAVDATLFSFERRVLDWRVRRILAGSPRSPRRLALGDGNAEFRARFDAARLVLEHRKGEAWCEIDAVGDARGGVAVSSWRRAEQALAAWLQRFGVEVVVAADPAAYGPRTAALITALGLPRVPR